MGSANIHDSGSIERVYPLDDFIRDSTENERPAAEVLRGVRVLSKPDKGGDFQMAPAAKHVAEAGDSAFLVPYRRTQAAPVAVYRDFIQDIIEAALRERFDPETSPGFGDPRIRGARQ